MSGIAGFYHPHVNYERHRAYYEGILEHMCQDLEHRGPDGSQTWLSGHFGLAQTWFATTQSEDECPTLSKRYAEHTFAIIFDGELYNADELAADLKMRGWELTTSYDTELMLTAYLEYGADFVTKVNGACSFAIMDTYKDRLLLYRDRSGIKPLFFMRLEEEVIFASEPKGIFAYPGIHPQIDHAGLNEIFSLGPAKTYGNGVFKDLEEVLPGHYLICTKDGISSHCYWQLQSRPHTDSYDDTVTTLTHLVKDAVHRQFQSDLPVCTFLSGGLDSSLVSALCAEELKEKNRQLTTFSFDFTDNQKYFQSNAFQPSLDQPYVDMMVKFLNSDHHYLECDNLSQADLLYASVDAHDLPCMADVDSSLLHFCSLVTDYSKAALTGECADEIFAGYPWYHRDDSLSAGTFPWTKDLNTRKILLRDDFIDYLHMDDYVSHAYLSSIAEVSLLPEETPIESRRRQLFHLNLKWFMQTLLDRMDRTSMWNGLSAKVPFADYRIIEYMWNVPWDMKARDGVVKHLLRETGAGLLPDEILHRKKSPYPKTYDTHYEALLVDRVKEIIHDSSSPILNFIDIKKTEQFLKSPSDYGKPWYGQLMAAPQMMAYVIQVNYWLQKYRIDVLT